jgi:hypothetical protein
MRHTCVCVAALLLAACATGAKPPAAWREACANETGHFIYEQPQAGGLADPDRMGHGAADLLLGSGATFVEVSHLRVENMPIPPLDALYAQGSGRYEVRLTRSAEPECAKLLMLWGYDPATLAHVHTPKRGVRLNGNVFDGACLSAKWVGSPAQMRFQFAPENSAAYIAQYSAPFHIRKIREKHARAAEDDRMFREAVQIVDNASGRVIAEEISLSYHTGDYFNPSVSCGPANEQSPSGWRTPVFQAPQL